MIIDLSFEKKNVPGSFVVALSVLESLCISSYSLKVGIKYPKNVISELPGADQGNRNSAGECSFRESLFLN